jgi:hypothetical protein
MPEVTVKDETAQLLAVFREAFEGPPESWSYFTDSGAESGLFGTLEKLDAAAASRLSGDTTIAAHAHHVDFALEASNAWIRGDRSSRNWPESWSVSTVDEPAWRRLQKELRDRYAHLCQTIETHASDSAEALGGSIGALAHAAYHLGAIRQKVAWSRKA